MKIRPVFFVLALLLAFPAVAHAHKVNIFAYVDGNTIYTDSGYSKSRRVQGGTVEVRDANSNELLLTGTTDDKGHFSFPVPKKALENKLDLALIIDAGVGHRGEWLVKYDEYAGEVADASAAEPDSDQGTTPETVEQSGAESASVDMGQLEKVVRRVVRDENASLKRLFAESRNEDPGFKEIFAGLGYLIGFAGILAYFRSKRK